jgi:cyanate permease
MDMEADGEGCPIRRQCARHALGAELGGAAVVAVSKVGSAVAVAAAGTGVAVYGWAAAVVLIACLAAVVFIIWWVLSDADRSTRLKEILGTIWSARR